MTIDSTVSSRYAKSIEAHRRRARVIAGGVNSNVRLASRPVPLTFARAAGAYMWDVDGNEYVDYAGGMGPMVLGHNHPRVLDAVRNALEIGQAFAGQNEFEAEFGERLVDTVPWIESIRVGLTGTEVDLLALRIARAATGRTKVLRFAGHYHGWLDPLLVGSGPIPEPFGRPPLDPGQSLAASDDVVICEWNDLALVEQVLESEQVAAVIMEPIMCNTGLIAPEPSFLEGTRDLCRRHGALLVVDEVITGFRLGLTGRAGSPRHQRRHHALRQGGGVRLPDVGAGDDARAARGRRAGRGQPLGYVQRRHALGRRRRRDVADPHRDEPVSRAGEAHGATRGRASVGGCERRASPSTTSAARCSSSGSARRSRSHLGERSLSAPIQRC